MEEAWEVHNVLLEALAPVMILGLSLRWAAWFLLRSAGR
jgi:hypothetical protein|tara:strand:+ start:321 stop:437 length:117 start_codon:yes stop_codon:yes gene_type:complete